MWILIAEIVGGSTTVIVLGAYALAYAVLRLEHRKDPGDQCHSLMYGHKYKANNWRCDFDVDHEGPHHAKNGSHDIWWTEEMQQETSPRGKATGGQKDMYGGTLPK